MQPRIVFYSFLVATLAGCITGQQEEPAPATQPDPRNAGPVDVREAEDAAGPSTPTSNEPLAIPDGLAVPPSREVTNGRQSVHREQTAKLASESLPYAGVPGQTAIASLPPDFRHPREPLYRERYQRPDDHRVVRVTEQPVSTFSIDVDTGSYSVMRRWLNQGQLPPEDAVRVEELINYFDYAYPLPERSAEPFLVSTEIAPAPWNGATHLLRIGIKGYQVPATQLPASNLVFLIDVSGSMRSADKLPLLKQALGMLVQSLDANDNISMVVYAGASGVVLNPTAGDQKAAILTALQQLEAGGSTNGAAGIRLAYQLAQQAFVPGGVNRVILATDGDFNVGLASTEELVDLVQRKRESGIALTTLGFGAGNYNDHLLEQLADEGNGNHAYIDRLSEARKVLAEELSATLLTIARDVKIQVEFNPATVAEYRLIGYENRILNEEDFNNDRVDAGEIGAGHSVTALYEISLTEAGFQRLAPRRYGHPGQAATPASARPDELAHVRVRYKLPGEQRSQLIEIPVLRSALLAGIEQASENFRFAAAVAAFGQLLRGGQYLESWGYDDIANLARQARGNDPFGYRSEFVQLVALAETLDAGQRVTRQHAGR